MNNRSSSGIWYAIAAYFTWGFLPIYWKMLQEVSSGEILAHRIFWSFVLVAVVLAATRRWRGFIEVLKHRSNRWSLLLSSALISTNWFIYIWAVNSNHVIEASLGYYINPLIVILLGMLVLKERLNVWQTSSLLLAAIGVLILAVEFGKIPWIAFSLALSFALYGLAKKLVKIDSLIGLGLETLFVVPFAILYLLFSHSSGSLGEISGWTWLLLIGTGAATAIPLFCFAQGAQRVPFSTMGFIQYLAPSISLLLGIFVFKEPFTAAHMVSFGFIWSALLLYTFSNLRLKLFIQPKVQEKDMTYPLQKRI